MSLHYQGHTAQAVAVRRLDEVLKGTPLLGVEGCLIFPDSSSTQM